ncbi:calcium-transporting ATPase 12 plasma membrane-type [Citrus sinensis]|uniref:Calcium-transporting ATPase 12 plasma membrane-type n=1 Tax=Citrus sinensis TaxID=2711 RepID=A0ACB8KFS3_CITSI|nr:calcium-transporting ATPase 12 plasma membrane-type [Citrus sinensis]
MSLTLRSRKPIENTMPINELELDLLVLSKRHQRRWRMAFRVICFTRALVSMSRKCLQNNNQILLRSLSYVAVDISTSDDHEVPFVGVNKQMLSKMVKEKSFESLSNLGGVNQVAAILESDTKRGISGNKADLGHRINVFGANRYKRPKAKSFISFVFEALKDTTIIILLVCALLSLGFGIKQEGLKEGWFDGGSIIFAVFLVVIVSAVSNFKQSRQFQALADESSDIRIEVVRDGRRQGLSIFDVVVGEIVCLKTGDQIPADGLFLNGHSLKVDESSMTGESDHVEVDEKSPFLLSGTKVTDGYGFMLVTSVGMSTAWGEMMSSISHELNEETPLQARLNKLTSCIGKIGLTVAVLVLAVMLIRYFTGNTRDETGKREFLGRKTKVDDVMNSVINIIAAAVTIIVVAIPEGLPLAVTLTLAFSMKRMMKEHAMVTEFWIGKEAMTGNASSSGLAHNLYELLQDAVGLNTIGNVYKSNSESTPEITGSPTEKAILSWAVLDLGMNVDEPKQCCKVINVEAFNSEKKRSGVLVKRICEKTVHIHWKGAAEMILAMCSHYYVKSGTIRVLDGEARKQIEIVIKDMAAKSLRCIAFAHTKVAEADGQVQEKLEETGLTLLGLVGLKDPCRPGVRAAVECCRNAGVNVKMVTGDNVHTARAIAIECGILNPDVGLNNDDAVIEGVKFRSLSAEERVAKIESIRVMARSSPLDKLLMVQSLKQKGHVVAVTGDGTNDAPALKAADIGLSMGIQGTEVAKESSDIVIMDDNFTSVVTVLRWGRCVYNNIQKFLQFQLTVNVAALVINFVAAVSSGKVPLTAVQLLWVNLIMDTLGALALATEQPTNDLMSKPPVGRSEPLITKLMWRNLIPQAIYQVTILLTLQFKGRSIFSVNESVKDTMIFNTFVFCQIFNEFNARKLEKKNIFKGIHKNKLFLAIIGITIVLQLIMVEFLKKFADTERLNWGQWAACIGIAAMSWPIGFLFKCIPVSGTQLLFKQRAS